MTMTNIGTPQSVGRHRVKAGLVLAALVIVLDQISKYVIVTVVMQPPQVIPVTGFFNLVLTWNRGVSFGLLSDSPLALPVILIGVALAIATILVVWMVRTDRLYTALCLGLIVGGAVGNSVDRWRYGAVVDFLDVHVGGWHWPAFNVADSAITVGVLFLVAETVLTRPPRA